MCVWGGGTHRVGDVGLGVCSAGLGALGGGAVGAGCVLAGKDGAEPIC